MENKSFASNSCVSYRLLIALDSFPEGCGQLHSEVFTLLKVQDSQPTLLVDSSLEVRVGKMSKCSCVLQLVWVN